MTKSASIGPSAAGRRRNSASVQVGSMAGFLVVWRVSADYHRMEVMSRVGIYKVLAIGIASNMMGHTLRTRTHPRIFTERPMESEPCLSVHQIRVPRPWPMRCCSLHGGQFMQFVSRRSFFTAASAGALAAVPFAQARESKDKPLKFRLGIVTYNIAATWDVPTMLKVCKNVGLSPVELRTSHKHGV